MNRHARRSKAATSAKRPAPKSGPIAETAPEGRHAPSFALRIFSRLLLSGWVLERVHRPDVVTILLQLATEVGRVDAVAQLRAKLAATTR